MSVLVDEPQAPERPTNRPRRAVWLALAVLLALCVGALGLGAWWNVRGGAPYPASALHPQVTLDVATPTHAQALVDQWAGAGRLNVPIGTGRGKPPDLLVGQLALDIPPGVPTDGTYELVVIDNRNQRPVDMTFGIGPMGSRVGQGGDYSFDALSQQYPWLSSLGSAHAAAYGQAVFFSSNTPSPITFVALPDRNSLPITNASQDFTLALVFMSADRHVYWAENLSD